MIKAPSKYCSRAFLEYLQANHYCAASGAEYCAEEVDALLNEKYAETCPIEAEQAYAEHFSRAEFEHEQEEEKEEMTEQEKAEVWLKTYSGSNQRFLDAQLDLDFGSSIPEELLPEIKKEAGYWTEDELKEELKEPFDLYSRLRPKEEQDEEEALRKQIKEAKKEQERLKAKPKRAAPVRSGEGLGLKAGDSLTLKEAGGSKFLQGVYAESDFVPGSLEVLASEYETRRAVRVTVKQNGKTFSCWIPKIAIKN